MYCTHIVHATKHVHVHVHVQVVYSSMFILHVYFVTCISTTCTCNSKNSCKHLVFSWKINLKSVHIHNDLKIRICDLIFEKGPFPAKLL